MFIMLVPDLGELAYGRGEGVVSYELAPAALEGEGTDLPVVCPPETYFKYFGKSSEAGRTTIINSRITRNQVIKLRVDNEYQFNVWLKDLWLKYN